MAGRHNVHSNPFRPSLLDVLGAAASLGATPLPSGVEARLRRGQLRAHPTNFLAVNILLFVTAGASATTGFLLLDFPRGLVIWSVLTLLSGLTVLASYLWLRASAPKVSYRALIYVMTPIATGEGLLCGLYAAAVGPDAGYFYYIIIGASSGALVMGGLAFMYTPPLSLWYTLVAGLSFSYHQLGRGLEGGLWIVFASLYVVILNLMLFIWFRTLTWHFTVRETANDRQHTIENLLRDFEENASDWLWEVDRDLNLTHVGPRMAEAAGRQPEELLGAHLIDLLDPDHPGTSSLLNRITGHRGFRRIEVGVRIAGCKLTVWEMSGQPITSSNGEETGYRGVGSDVTERMALERLRLSQERHDVLSRVSAGLAHDFNNLLQAVVANLDMMPMKGPITSAQEQTLARAKSAVSRAGHVTGQLLAYTRQEVLSPRPIELSTVVSRIVTEQAELAQLPDVTVDITSDITIRADPYLFDRAVANVVKNACEAVGAEGKITVTAAEYTDEDGTDMAVLEIRDSGPGFPPDHLEIATEPFFTTKQAQGGSGLGLSLAAGFARQSGGTLRVANHPNGGAEVSLILPSVDLDTLEAHRPRPTLDPDLMPAPVLVLEDEEQVATAIADQLQARGFPVVVAHTLSEGLVQLANASFAYAVIDLVLPDGSGLVAVREAEASGVSVVTITGYRGLDLPDSDLHHPVLRKPFQAEELLHRMAELQQSATSSLANRPANP